MTLEASERTNGIVVGRLYACDEKMRDEFAQMVKDQCDGTIFPILLNVDVEYTDSPLGSWSVVCRWQRCKLEFARKLRE